ELKEKLYRKLGKAQKQDDGRNQRSKVAFARELHLPVVNGKVAFPDVRIEYANQEMEISRVDLELATGHYHAQHLSEKARACLQVPRAARRAWHSLKRFWGKVMPRPVCSSETVVSITCIRGWSIERLAGNIFATGANIPSSTCARNWRFWILCWAISITGILKPRMTRLLTSAEIWASLDSCCPQSTMPERSGREQLRDISWINSRCSSRPNPLHHLWSLSVLWTPDS